jgi:CheY-like chemotaxis protein
LAAVRVNPPEPMPRIFVLTGSNEPKDRDMVKDSGMATGYVVKPLSVEHLTSIFGPPLR